MNLEGDFVSVRGGEAMDGDADFGGVTSRPGVIRGVAGGFHLRQISGRDPARVPFPIPDFPPLGRGRPFDEEQPFPRWRG